MDILDDLGWAYLSWLLLAVPVGIGLVVLWSSCPAGTEKWSFSSLFRGKPELSFSRCSWNGFSVLGAAILYFTGPALAFQVADQIYGEPLEDYATVRHYIVLCFTAPILIGSIVGLLWLSSGIGFSDLGIHTRGWRLASLLGGLLWLIVTPAVLSVHAAASFVNRWFTETTPESHQLVNVVGPEESALRWLVLVVSAVVVAPIFEEFLFRGILGRWARQMAWRSHAIFCAAVAMGLTRHSEVFEQVSVLVVVLSGVYVWIGSRDVPTSQESTVPLEGDDSLSDTISREPVQLRPRSGPPVFADLLDTKQQNPVVNHQLANLAQAALFGLIHAPWPSPIPLVILALVLGWVMGRTNSLWGPIVLHALFNGTACVLLALQRLMA
ncbi:MAG: lysostaphin resistance A-like protein [Gemmataceae bacterium]